jgi:hypothetical protein
VASLKTRYRLQAFKDGGAVKAAEDVSRTDVPLGAIEGEGDASFPPSPSTPDWAVGEVELPQRAWDWLKRNPEYLEDKEKNDRLQALHHVLVDEGHEEYSPKYFSEMDRRLKPVRRQSDNDEPLSVKAAIRSAPVSRSVPTSAGSKYDLSGKPRLTPQQIEACRISGCSIEDYQDGLMRLMEEKSRGDRGGSP